MKVIILLHLKEKGLISFYFYHVALYVGNYKIVEADPHMENWSYNEKRNYPGNAATLHYKSYRARYDQNHYGKVEFSLLSEITSGLWYEDYLYAWVRTSPNKREEAADWAKIRATPHWPFDYKSPWIIHSKQYENWNNPDEITYWKKSYEP